MDEDIKRCSKCKMDCLKLNFYKGITKNDGYRPSCKRCTNQYYYDNQNQILDNRKIYIKNNRSKINAYERDKRKSDSNFKLHCNIRQNTNYAFRSQNNEKINHLIGCSNYFFRKWIIYQLYGDMRLENYGKVWCLDHCYPLSKISLSNGNDLIKYTNWHNITPMYIRDNIIKGGKINQHLCLLQEVKAKYFMKLNGQEGLN